jgi:hypothetical protein
MARHRLLLGAAMALLPLLAPSAGRAVEPDANDAPTIGIKLRVGGRFDNVRMCVGSPPGVPGGPAADLSLFAEFPLGDATLAVDLPVMRPILFGAAFQMLQFEPSVALLFQQQTDGKVALVGGPVLGLSLHYGPDYHSAQAGENRGPSFFALGPTVGGYLGLDFQQAGEPSRFQLGLTPYVTPLFAVSDPEGHRGVVVGALLDGSLRLRAP